MTSKVFTQFDDGLPVDVNKEYWINSYLTDTGLQKIHKMCLFPSKLQEYIKDKEYIINSKTSSGYTPLMISVMNDVTESVKILLDHRSALNINIQHNIGVTALFRAIHTSNEKIIKLLLEYGADVNIQSNIKNTALMWAMDYGNNIKSSKLLLEYGADVNLKNIYGTTALTWCRNKKCLKLLLQYGAKTDTYSNILTNVQTILSNIDTSTEKKLKKFDYNSILLFELKKCVF